MDQVLLDNDVLSGRLRSLLGCERKRTSFGLRLVLGSALLLWGIPAALSHACGRFFAGAGVISPFSHDVSMYALFLFSMPILLANGPAFSRVQNGVLQAMRDEGVLTLSDEAYADLVARTNGILSSGALHTVMLVAAWVASLAWAYTSVYLVQDSWHSVTANSGLPEPTWALWYVALVAMPMPLYVIIAWSYKAIVWNWFVYQLTRSGLHVNALHPDGAAGLGFFRYSALAWGSYILCVGVTIAGDVCNHLYVLQSVSFRWDVLGKIGAYVLIAPAVFLCPLLLLAPHIARARKEGELLLFGYGMRYADEIATTLRESRAAPEKEEPPSAHQGYWSGLCDYLTVYDSVRSLRFIPLDLGAFVRIALTVLAPLIPLLAPKLPLVAGLLESFTR